MKKHVFKSFALIAMLFSALSMSAVSYCGETITATDVTVITYVPAVGCVHVSTAVVVPSVAVIVSPQ